MKMDGVTEYVEGLPVEIRLALTRKGYRIVVMALTEAGNGSTEVDLYDLIAWLKKNRPELLE